MAEANTTGSPVRHASNDGRARGVTKGVGWLGYSHLFVMFARFDIFDHLAGDFFTWSDLGKLEHATLG